MNKMNITRIDVVVAVSNSFGVDEIKIKKLLDKEYPKAFFPIITIKEYQYFLHKYIDEFISNIDITKERK